MFRVLNMSLYCMETVTLRFACITKEWIKYFWCVKSIEVNECTHQAYLWTIRWLYADVAARSAVWAVYLGRLGYADVTASLNPVLGLYLWLLSDIDLVFPPHVQSNKAPIFQTYCSVLLNDILVNLISNWTAFTKDMKFLCVFVNVQKGQSPVKEKNRKHNQTSKPTYNISHTQENKQRPTISLLLHVSQWSFVFGIYKVHLPFCLKRTLIISLTMQCKTFKSRPGVKSAV